MNTLGYSDYESGFRHGKRDYCVGLRSPALLTECSEYADGYRNGIKDGEIMYHDWLRIELGE